MEREGAAFRSGDRSALASFARKKKRGTQVARSPESAKSPDFEPKTRRFDGFSTVENVSLFIITRNASRFKRDGRRFPILSVDRGNGATRRRRRRGFGRVAEICGTEEKRGSGVIDGGKRGGGFGEVWRFRGVGLV